MNTRQVLELLIKNSPEDLAIVSSLGRTAQEVYYLKPKQTLFLDSMGDVVSTGLGVALGLKTKPVLAVDTDGSHLMGITILSSIASLRPMLDNFCLVVLNNNILESAGGIRTTEIQPNWAKLGEAWNIKISRITDINELKKQTSLLYNKFTFLVVDVNNTEVKSKEVKKSIDGIESKYLFSRHLEKVKNEKFIFPAKKN